MACPPLVTCKEAEDGVASRCRFGADLEYDTDDAFLDRGDSGAREHCLGGDILAFPPVLNDDAAIASSAADSLEDEEALTVLLNLVIGTLFRRGSSGEILCLIFVPSERVLTAQ